MVIIDSSVWIEAGRRQGDLGCKVALESLLEEYEAALCSPVRLEVLGGARVTERLIWKRAFNILPYLPVTEKVWESAVGLGWKIRDAGFSVPWNDLLVAALAIDSGCRVFARDKHFDLMSQHLPFLLYQPSFGGSYNPGTEE